MHQMLTLRNRRKNTPFLLGINQKVNFYSDSQKELAFILDLSLPPSCDDILINTTPRCTALKVKHDAYSSSPHQPQDLV